MNYRSIFSLVTLLISLNTFAQRNVRDSSIATPLLGIQYGGMWTEGDLKDRYAFFNHVGFTSGYKFASKWYVGLEGNFMFGRKMNFTREQLFGDLMDSYGNITDQNGDIATVLIFSRGFHANVEFGRLIPVLSPNVNSGFLIKVGVGYLNHRIRIESNDHVVPSLELDYKKGYDRLTAGINTSQFLGYMLMGDHSYLNFYGGVYLQEGFTHNKRTVFFDQPDTPVPTETRLDIQYGAKIGWLIPVYKRQPKDFYYN